MNKQSNHTNLIGNVHPSVNKRIHAARIFSKKVINFQIQIHLVDVEPLHDDGHGSSRL